MDGTEFTWLFQKIIIQVHFFWERFQHINIGSFYSVEQGHEVSICLCVTLWMTVILTMYVHEPHETAHWGSGSCSAADRLAQQQVLKTAQRILCSSLPMVPDIYTSSCRRKATCILKDSTHPAFVPLPSGRRLSSIMAASAGLRSCIFPDAVTLTLPPFALWPLSNTPPNTNMVIATMYREFDCHTADLLNIPSSFSMLLHLRLQCHFPDPFYLYSLYFLHPYHF